MLEASAPGSVFLFGEHAVVYGHPAIVVAIDEKIHVTVAPNKKGVVRVTSVFGSQKIPLGRLRGKPKYVLAAIRKIFELTGKPIGLNIKIKSKLPPASGLGTSSAVTVATLKAASKLLGLSLSKNELVFLAREVEKEIQGRASLAGVSAATLGGILEIRGDRYRELPYRDFDVVIGYSGIPSRTARMIQKVWKLRENNRVIVDTIFEAIGELAEAGAIYLRKGEWLKLGMLMNINHALLGAMRVVHPRVEKMVKVSRDAGAYGAKLTGAGGGGCMIALIKDKKPLKELRRLGFRAFCTKPWGRS